MAKAEKAGKAGKAGDMIEMIGREDVAAIAIPIEGGASASYEAKKGRISVHPDHVSACETAGYRVAE